MNTTPFPQVTPTVSATGPRHWLGRLADALAWLTPHSLLALVNRVGIAAIFWMSARVKSGLNGCQLSTRSVERKATLPHTC